MQNRNEMMPAGYEDRAPELGTDDRFTGRGRSPFWQDRQDRGYDPERYGAQGGYGGGRGFEPERLGPSRGSAGEGYGREDRIGYLGNAAPGSRHMGYDSTASGWSPNPGYHQRQGGEGGSTQRDRETGQHMHRSTGPHRGKGPAGYQRSDERLREMICEQLADDDQLDASGIEVTVKNGEVTLSGSVDDRRAKRDAEDCACTVSGIRDIQNQLRIRDDRQAGRPSFAGSSNAGQSSTGQSQKIETETGTDKKHRA
jgi:hypothetical protein